MIAGRQLVKSSYYVSKSKALEEFPMLKDERLCGAIVYYDGGEHNSAHTISSLTLSLPPSLPPSLPFLPLSHPGQHNDARMNLAIALTAAREGAAVANHVEAVGLLKETVCMCG